MNKTDFLAQLADKLRERGIEETVIARHTQKLECLIPELLSEVEDLDTIADEISILLKKRTDSEPRESARPAPDEAPADEIKPAEPAEDSPPPSGEGQPGPPGDTPDVSDGADAPSPPADPSQPPDIPEILPEYEPPVEKFNLFAAIKAFFSAPKRELTEAERRGNRLFWLFFGLSLPVTAGVILSVLLLFGGVYLALLAAIVAMLGGLILMAAGGTALSLVGIIYGITQLFSHVPVGLYEIGLGVIIGGSAMFSGILLYNVALRLIPYVIRKLGVFFVYLCRQTKKLFLLAKGACVKL